MEQQNLKKTGMLLTAISAIIYGISPIYAKISYLNGSNGVMLTFLRNFFPLPVLYYIVRQKGLSMQITKQEHRKLFLLALLTSSTTATLYSSYIYIPVGTATVLHFTYPTMVMLGSVIFLKESLSKPKIIALIISSIGISMFFQGGLDSFYGFFIAFLSGVLFAIYILYVDKSRMKSMYPFLYSFYICFYGSFIMLAYSLFSGDFTLQLNGKAWAYSVAIALSTSIFALSFLQMGIKRVGPSMAAIISMLEPITGVLFGVIVLQEHFSFSALVGCICILSAIVVLAKK